MRLLTTLPDLDDTRVILDELPHRFPAQAPQFRKIAHAVVFFGEARVTRNVLHFQGECRPAHVLNWSLAQLLCVHSRLHCGEMMSHLLVEDRRTQMNRHSNWR